MRIFFRNGVIKSDFADRFPHFILTSYEHKALAYIRAILAAQPTFSFTTSGSTGVPQKVVLKYSQCSASAAATRNYFGFDQGQKPALKLLCCLNVDFIAGFMMLFRACQWDADLYVVEPQANPIAALPPNVVFDFCSLVPLQLQTLLEHDQEALKTRFKRILLGGAPVSAQQQSAIVRLGLEAYIGYGMTETCSHIALKQLNESNSHTAPYTLLPGVETKQDQRGCLAVRGVVTDGQWVQTNDLVAIDGNTLEVLGRYDRVFNTGGIKVSAEWIEDQIQPLMQQTGYLKYHVTAVPDNKLGERIVLLVESQGITMPSDLGALQDQLSALDSYKMPKEIILIDSLPVTPTGKIDLVAARALSVAYTKS